MSTGRGSANSSASSTPTTPNMRKKARKIRNKLPSTPISASTERQLHAARLEEVVTKTLTEEVEGLKAFDSCIEASDALASTSTCTGRGVDSSSGLVNCSVLVSPEGELLIIPQQKHKDENYGKEEEAEGLKTDWQSSTQSDELGEEYNSAVFLGNDLHSQGDKRINGFSAKGWSMAATSLALKQSADSIDELSHFLEDLVLTKKMSAAQENQSIDKLRKVVGVHEATLSESRVANYQKYLQDKFSAETQRAMQMNTIKNKIKKSQQQSAILEVSSDRVGPLNYSGSSISDSLKALENYYSSIAESDSKLWSDLSNRTGALTELRNASKKTEDRVNGRQVALQETMRRIKAMEDYLSECKVNAKNKWDRVHETEVKISHLVEERMMEQNKIREEQQRIKHMKENFDRMKSDNGGSGATSSEIWHMVSEATRSMEEGSFEPVVDLSNTASSILADIESSHDPSKAETPDPFEASERIDMESDARYEFEVQYRLPELRVQAIAAEEAVEDAANSLLSVLSNWDTTTRSAQLAAETCLVSCGNAQATCLRSVIAVEREAIQERLKLLDELEDVVNKIDTRTDLNEYIAIDKTKPGGRSLLGEDDDGGVASALIHLRGELTLKHESEVPEKSSTAIEESGEETGADPFIDIEETLKCFFKRNPNLSAGATQSDSVEKALEEFESNVIKLCKIGEGHSSKSATRRSTICYAMNANRNSNAEIPSLTQFEGLCRVFVSVLSGCATHNGSGISCAILLMGLSEHFYIPGEEESSNKVFVKSRLVGHSLWDKDNFWDRALHHSVTEKLNYSGVMSNFERNSDKIVTMENKKRSEWTEAKKTKWHDLSEVERYEAAAQVNAVVYAQVSAMSDLMLELCGNLEKTTSFVRRVCVRNRLPVSQRSTLLRHLIGVPVNGRENAFQN